MLEPEGNAILVAQNKIGGATADLTDVSGNSKPVNIAFSAELTRAHDSISDQTAGPEQTIVTDAEVNDFVGRKVTSSRAEGSNGSGLDPEPMLGSVAAQSQNISATRNRTDDPEATLLGVQSAQEAKSPIDEPATLQTNTGENKQSQAPTYSINPDLSLRNVIEPSSNVEDSNLLSGLNTAISAPAAVQVLEDEISQASVAELTRAKDENEALGAASKTIPNVVSNTVSASIAPADLLIEEKQVLQSTPQVLNNMSEKVMAGERQVPVPVEIDKITDIAESPITAKTTTFTATAEFTKASVQVTDIKADDNQAANAALLYKPSAGLIQSGLGRTSVELNSGVNLSTQASTRAIEPGLSSPSVLLNPLLSSSVGSSLITAAVSDEVVKVPLADQLRSIGNWQTEPNDEILSSAKRTTGTITNPDEIKQSVSIQAVNGSASPVGLANTPPQISLTELAMPKGSSNTAETVDVTSSNTGTAAKIIGDTNTSGANFGGGESKNHQQQLAQAAATAVDEDVALTQLRESVAVEQQNRFSNVTPGISLRQVVKADQSTNITSLQSLTGTADLTSSNVYHATSNGIITAHSTPLNTGLVADLASAPRTVLLAQPGADESLLENLRWVVNEKLSRATINVSPANLGPITVSVDLENQNMNVSIIANNTIAKDAIDSLLPRMREHFGNEGYQQVSVDVSSQQERQGSLRNQSGLSLEQESGAEADTRDADNHDKELVGEEKKSTFDDQRTSEFLIDTYV